MAHLRQRFCLVPFSDLTDCPEAVHHAIGSPYFDEIGRPLFTEPVVIAVRANIVDTALPRCSALAVSCNTRPYHSYGPVMRQIFETSQPHNYPQVRRGMEGVMEVGEVREVPPGGLESQTERLLFGCVTPMTGTTSPEILKKVLNHFVEAFARLPAGSTMRMPIIGTGKARQSAISEEDAFCDVIGMTLAAFASVLLPQEERVACRRLLIVNPVEYESQILAKILAQKAVFLTLLDKLGIFTTDPRLVYGLAHGDKPANRFVEEAEFSTALDCFDQALDCLIAGERQEAIKNAARGAEKEPGLMGICSYIASFANRPNGLREVITQEALSLAAEGRVRDAFYVAHTLSHIGGAKKENELIAALRDSYLAYCVAALEARLLYERYMEAEEVLANIYRAGVAPEHGFVTDHQDGKSAQIQMLSNLGPLQAVEAKIPQRLIENTFHIVIRKFMSDQVETHGARRALENLMDFHRRGKVVLNADQERACQELFTLANFIDQNKEVMPLAVLQKNVVEQLLVLIPNHGTLRLEAARFYLRSADAESSGSGKTISRTQILQAWDHLEKGYQAHPRDFGILSYLGFIIFLQGNKFLRQAEEFYLLFGKLLDGELSHGRFGLRQLRVSAEGNLVLPFRDPPTQMAYDYYKTYRNHAQCCGKLAKALAESEITAAMSLYREVTQSFREIGRYDLARLYDEILGETWVALLCRTRFLGSIPIPFIGEISLDLLLNLYRKIRYWWKYRKLTTTNVQPLIPKMLETIRKQL